MIQGNVAVDKALLVGIIQGCGQGIENIGRGFQVDNTIVPAQALGQRLPFYPLGGNVDKALRLAGISDRNNPGVL